MSYGKTTLISRSGYGGHYLPVGGALDKIGDFVKGAGAGLLNLYGQSKTDAGAAAYALEVEKAKAAAAAGGGMPSWLLPVGLVAGVGIVALVLLKRPRANPARGLHKLRRSSRRSYRRRRGR